VVGIQGEMHDNAGWVVYARTSGKLIQGFVIFGE